MEVTYQKHTSYTLKIISTLQKAPHLVSRAYYHHDDHDWIHSGIKALYIWTILL